VDSIAGGKAPAIMESANVPINPIIVNNTPNIIRFEEVFDILTDPLQSNMNVLDSPLLIRTSCCVDVGNEPTLATVNLVRRKKIPGTCILISLFSAIGYPDRRYGTLVPDYLEFIPGTKKFQ